MPVSNKIVKYKCEVCGYEYNESLGDKQGKIMGGTPFKDLPQGWKCPVCGADKDRFFEVITPSL